MLTVMMQASPVLVAYGTNHSHQGLTLLRDTAHWHGWSALHVIGTTEGFQKHHLVDKLAAMRRFAKKWPDETILVFVDGYDVIVNNEPSQLETAFLDSGKRILISSELGCCTNRETALKYMTTCHPHWPFISDASRSGGRAWLNSGALVGYASDIRYFLRLAWKEYKQHPVMYRAYSDQQVLCYLMSDGATVWTRASVGIDHMSEVALSMYQTNIQIGQVLGFDTIGRIVFFNRTVPAIIHFNGPKDVKAAQIEYAIKHFPLLQRWRGG